MNATPPPFFFLAPFYTFQHTSACLASWSKMVLHSLSLSLSLTLLLLFGVLVKDGLARRHRLFMTRGRLHHADSSGEGGEGREGREGREGGEKGEKGEEREEREEGEEGEEA